MARTFSKNLSNHMLLALGQIGTLLDGASIVSFHARGKASSLSSGAGDNFLFGVRIGGNLTGLAIGVDGSVTPNVMRAFTRSGSGDSSQSQRAVSAFDLGEWHSCGAVARYADDRLSVYFNGRCEGVLAASYGNNAYTHAAVTSARDAIGCADNNGSGPSSTGFQFDGDLAEIAIWRDVDIGSEGFAQLCAGESAAAISPGNLVFYHALIGDSDVEPDRVAGIVPTITGAVPVAQHPYIDTADDSGWLLPFTVSAGGLKAHPFFGGGATANPLWGYIG